MSGKLQTYILVEDRFAVNEIEKRKHLLGSILETLRHLCKEISHEFDLISFLFDG
jgi:hypothetical protein